MSFKNLAISKTIFSPFVSVYDSTLKSETTGAHFIFLDVFLALNARVNV